MELHSDPLQAHHLHDELERVVLHCGVPYHIEVLAVATGALQKGTAILDVGKKVGLCLKDG